MGSSYSRGEKPPPPTAGETKPTGARVHLASDVVAALMPVLQEHVIRGQAHHANEERECYEVARTLRGAEFRFKRAIRDIVPGSSMSKGDRLDLVEKIVMVFLDTVSLVLIRPGPTPEDRQAGDMVKEADLLVPMLTDLIAQVIAVDDKALKLPAAPDQTQWSTF